MNHEGYGITIKGKPHGIWPQPLSEARIAAKRYEARGFAEVHIVTVHSGESVSIKEPTPIFAAEPVSA